MGGLMGGFGGGGMPDPVGDLTSTTTTGPPEWLAPYLRGGMSTARDLSEMPRSYVSSYTPPSGAWGASADYLRQAPYQYGSRLAQLRMQGVLDQGGGPALSLTRFQPGPDLAGYSGQLNLQDPLNAAVDRAVQQAVGQTAGRYATAGRTGSPAAAAAAARAGSDVATQMTIPALQAEYAAGERAYDRNARTWAANRAAAERALGLTRQAELQEYGAGVGNLDRMMRAAGMMPGLDRAQYAPSAAAYGQIAQLDDMRRQAPALEAARRAQFMNEEPRQRLAEYLAAFGGIAPYAGSTSTSAQPLYGPPAGANMLGSALSGAQMGGELGSMLGFAGPWGAGIGAGLGLLFG